LGFSSRKLLCSETISRNRGKETRRRRDVEMKTKRNGKRSVLVQPALEVSLLSVPSLFSSLSNANTFPFTFRECSIADR